MLTWTGTQPHHPPNPLPPTSATPPPLRNPTHPLPTLHPQSEHPYPLPQTSRHLHRATASRARVRRRSPRRRQSLALAAVLCRSLGFARPERSKRFERIQRRMHEVMETFRRTSHHRRVRDERFQPLAGASAEIVSRRRRVG